METITLKLWVSNQYGCDSDMTYSYLQASRWKAPAGVILDINAQTLSGPPEKTWEAYRSLAEAVAANGHGVDCDWADDPCLTAATEDDNN